MLPLIKSFILISKHFSKYNFKNKLDGAKAPSNAKNPLSLPLLVPVLYEITLFFDIPVFVTTFCNSPFVIIYLFLIKFVDISMSFVVPEYVNKNTPST